MDDDDCTGIFGSQIVPTCTPDDIVIHNTNITQLKKDHGAPVGDDHIPLSGAMFQGISSQDTSNVPISMQHSVQEDVTTNDQLLKNEYRIEVVEVPYEQNEPDEHGVPIHRDRCSTTSESSTNDQTEKSSTEIIHKQFAFFPHEHVSFSTHWHSYRIKMPNNNDLGLVAPCEMIKLPTFNLYENGDATTVELVYIGSIDYKEFESQLEDFCRYIFEEVFNNMNTGSEAILTYDVENSPLKLLPCFLKQSGDIDYQRMALICNRKNKLIQDPSELNDQEVYMRLNSPDPDKNFYMNLTSASLPKQASDRRKDSLKIRMKRIKKPNIYYFKKSLSTTNQEPSSQTMNLSHSLIGALRYAPLNQTDLELIYKLPSILVRISQLYYIEQLRQILADNIQSYSVQLNILKLLGIDQMPIVTFGDCLSSILSSSQSTSTVLPLVSLNYDLLSANKCEYQPSPDILFQSITRRSAHENTNMDNLAVLGDCFLNLVTSISLYHRYPLDDTGVLTKKKINQILNNNLYRISVEKGLKHYLNSIQTCFSGKNANWIPPGFMTDEENAERYTKQKAKQKPFADMIEALIGTFLISTNYLTTIKFMNWSGLDVIPTDEHDRIMKIPPVLQINEADDFNGIENSIKKIYNEHSLVEIEKKINYDFNDKAYLVVAFTHSSYSDTNITIKRLKFIGNKLLEFLITRYIFIKKEKETITPGVVTDIRQDLLNSHREANIMEANDLHTKIICPSPKIPSPISSNAAQKDLSIDEEDVHQRADIFEALLGAIFFDSNYSLKTVWDVIDLLFRKHVELDYLIENPTLNIVRLVHELRGKITDEPNDANGNYVCNVELPDGTKHEGRGKNKRLAKKDACKKVKI